jgi:hypothetical protein
MEPLYNRTAEDVGNIVHLEHVNVTIPDQQCATLFYVTGLARLRGFAPENRDFRPAACVQAFDFA